MNFKRLASKVFAVFLLLFVNFILASAQIRNDSSAYDIQAGTRVSVSLENEINSKVASVNDTFTATVSEPLIIRETVVLPAGTVIEGRIIKSSSAGLGGVNGNLIVVFETLRLENGVKRQIEAVLVKQPRVKSSTKSKMLAILGATALGGIVGVASKKENGALIGAGTGAGAGIGYALLQKGGEIRIKTDEKFEIEFVKNVALPAQDF